MMFEIPENIDMLDDNGIQKLQEKLDVNISIKPKQRQANKSVLIKAQVSRKRKFPQLEHVTINKSF